MSLLSHVLATYATGLVGAWRFVSTPWVDSSGAGHTLTDSGSLLTGRPTLLGDGSGDTSTKFSGGNNAYAAAASWMNGSSISMFARVRTPAAGLWSVGGLGRIISHPQQYRLMTRYVSGSTATLELFSYVTGTVVADYTVAEDTVYSVGFTLDGTTAKLYVDGVLVDSGACGVGTATTDFLQLWDKGLEAWSSTGGPLYYWVGRALTGPEHADLHTKATTMAVAPGVPTSVAWAVGTDPVTELDLTWAAPATGGTPTGYRVRINGGTATDVGLVLAHTFTGLTGSTAYTLEVQAYNATGSSSWVLVTGTTDAPPPPPPPGYYRGVFDVGPLSYDIEHGDTPAYGPRLPVSLVWSIPDQSDYFPAQSTPATMTFQLLVTAADAQADDLAEGARVHFRMYVDTDPGADPFQWFDGVITQLEAEVRADAGDVLLTVFATSDTGSLALPGVSVGYTADWPEESIGDRLGRIVAECTSMTLTYHGVGTGLEGTLPARPATSGPISAYAALRAALDNGALENTSELPDGPFYGRPVMGFVWDGDPTYGTSGELTVTAFERRVYPDSTVTLDGCKVDAGLRWRKLPGGTVPQWNIVDGIEMGSPVGPPAIVRTALVDTTPINWSAATRDNMGESLLPDGSTQLAGYYATQVRYYPHDETPGVGLALAELVTGWASHDPVVQVQPVVITDLAAAYQLNGTDYLAGTLTGARLVIPPGGRFYLELALRPELLPGTDLP